MHWCEGMGRVAILIALVAAASVAFAGTSPLGCYERVRQDSLLSQAQALRLCQGARSSAPLSCFVRARDETLLSENESIELCRCTASVAPVACYERAQNQTALGDQGTLALCSPAKQHRLGPDCLPLAGVAPYRRIY